MDRWVLTLLVVFQVISLGCNSEEKVKDNTQETKIASGGWTLSDIKYVVSVYRRSTSDGEVLKLVKRRQEGEQCFESSTTYSIGKASYKKLKSQSIQRWGVDYLITDFMDAQEIAIEPERGCKHSGKLLNITDKALSNMIHLSEGFINKLAYYGDLEVDRDLDEIIIVHGSDELLIKSNKYTSSILPVVNINNSKLSKLAIPLQAFQVKNINFKLDIDKSISNEVSGLLESNSDRVSASYLMLRCIHISYNDLPYINIPYREYMDEALLNIKENNQSYFNNSIQRIRECYESFQLD